MLAIISPKYFLFPSHTKKLKLKIYKTVILPVVLYGCKTWSPTLGEGHSKLRVSENRVMIFRHKRDEDGSWRKLHDELHSLHSSLNIVRMIKSRKMRWAGQLACMGEGISVYRLLVGGAQRTVPREDLGKGGRITLRWTLGI
jgi:hypothetical protein